MFFEKEPLIAPGCVWVVLGEGNPLHLSAFVLLLSAYDGDAIYISIAFMTFFSDLLVIYKSYTIN
jgi:hypothetical protein